MTATAMLMREVVTLPQECVEEVLDYTIFLIRRRGVEPARESKISIESAYGIFKGIDPHFERDEEDRV
jgi:hypothetical protein